MQFANSKRGKTNLQNMQFANSKRGKSLLEQKADCDK